MNFNFDELKEKFSRFLKEIRKNEKFERIVAKLLPYVMRFSYYTTRWTIVGKEIPDAYHKNRKPFIVCLWHDRLMLAPCVWCWEKPLHVLASSHRDGRLIAKVVENFSMPVVYGSTGKQGTAAAKNLIKLVRQGEYVAVIPDGPQGPRHKLAPGAIAISRLSNADILVYSFVVKRFTKLNSWDKFIIVWPFNRGVMVWGKPISPKELKGLSEADAVALVESRINDASNEAYRLLKNAENA